MDKIVGHIRTNRISSTINYPGAGDSAYMVAVNNGFIGTEQEWLASLKGDKGDTGTSNIDDVQVDGVSVVKNKIANIQLRQVVIDILVEYGLIKLESLTEEQRQALNEMECTIDENGELNITFNETVLNLDFQIEDGNLIINNNINATFNINENKELEVIYNGD